MKRSDWQESKYINQADVGSRRHELVIDRVTPEEVDPDAGVRKPVMYFMNHQKGLVLNNTTWSACESEWGEESDAWSGHRVTLYVDPSVTYKGKRTGGTRIEPVQTKPLAIDDTGQEEEPPMPGDGDEPPF